jgi:hypothetical protein
VTRNYKPLGAQALAAACMAVMLPLVVHARLVVGVAEASNPDVLGSAAVSAAAGAAEVATPYIVPIQAIRLAPNETLVLDGSLSHPAWQRAPVHSLFFAHAPVFATAVPQATRVQVLFDDKALFVGVTALDTEPALIRDPMVRNDQVKRTQDFVALYIDAIGSKRSAQFFRVNAAGSTGDGLHTASDDSEDFSPDFDWDAAVARHVQGYTVVYRIPFASLRFAPGVQSWRIMVARRLPRAQFHLLTSAPIPREVPSFIHNLQPLQGVELPADTRFFTLRPSLTLRREEAPSPQGDPQSRQRAVVSLDAKWRPLPQAVLDATLNPDFSQVALDVPQLAGNTRFALFYPEKRPFFFESADLLRTPTEAIYTRSFTEPRWGLRGTWRSNAWAGTALALDDRGQGLVLMPDPYGTGGAEQPASRVWALRARSDGAAEWLPAGLQLGAVAATREYAHQRGSNTVLGPDLAWQLSRQWRLRAQWLHAETTAQPQLEAGRMVLRAGAARSGDLLYTRLYHQTDNTEANAGVEDIGSGFRHDSGFVSQVGVRKFHAWGSHGWFGLGPFNQFWVNTEWNRVVDRSTGAVVSERLRPGLWAAGASNLEWWLEYHGHSVLRTAFGAPLLRENYLSTGVVVTPAAWFPMLDAQLDLGRLADSQADDVRPGGRFNLTTQLRPSSRLELETATRTAWLREGGQRRYSETAVQGLAVWHFNARHNLRAIAEWRRFSRRSTGSAAPEESRNATVSLTYGWRESAGTVLYVGYSRARNELVATDRRQELFVKWQLDLDEARALWRQR